MRTDMRGINIITAKPLSRRTVLRGVGATVALPFLDAMAPGVSALARPAARPVRRFQAIFVPNGMAMEYWTPATVGRDFELTPDSAALGAVPGPDARLLGAPLVVDLRPRRRFRLVPDRHAARRHVRDGRGGRHVDRPDARERGRRLDPARLARAVDRQGGQRGAVHLGPQLRLHPDDLVAHAHHAAADGEQPAGGVRAPVRRQRLDRPRRAAGAHGGEAEHPRLGEGQAGRRRAPRRDRRSAARSRTMPRPSATSSDGSRWRNRRATRIPRSSQRSRGACRPRSRSTSS